MFLNLIYFYTIVAAGCREEFGVTLFRPSSSISKRFQFLKVKALLRLEFMNMAYKSTFKKNKYSMNFRQTKDMNAVAYQALMRLKS